jgi:3'-5' exonuclease
MDRNIIFDIETGSGPEDTILQFADIQRKPAHKGLKDPEKVAANLAQIEADYEAAKRDFIDRAALNAETGMVLAIGFQENWQSPRIYENNGGNLGGEKLLLEAAFDFIEGCYTDGQYSEGLRFIGHNIKSFDIPYLCRRAMRHGIYSERVRYLFWDKATKWKYWHTSIIDTMETWAMGEYGRRISLNGLARYFGLGEKTGTGDQFAKWYLGGERDRAIEYLQQDLALTMGVAIKMGVMDATL